MIDRTPLSEDILILLGAFVDGALTEEERAIVEDMAEKDPRISAELEGLLELNTDLQDVFDNFFGKAGPHRNCSVCSSSFRRCEHKQSATAHPCSVAINWSSPWRRWHVVQSAKQTA